MRKNSYFYLAKWIILLTHTHTHTHTSRRLIFARNILIYKRFAKQISSFLCDLSCTYLSYSKVIDWFPAILQSYFYPRIIFKT